MKNGNENSPSAERILILFCQVTAWYKLFFSGQLAWIVPWNPDVSGKSPMWHMCRWCSHWILGHPDRWIHARWMSLRPNRRTFFPQSVYIPMIDGLIPSCSCLKRWYLHMFLFQNVDFTNSHSSFSSFTTFHDKHSIYILFYSHYSAARARVGWKKSWVIYRSAAMELLSRAAGAGDEQDGLGLWRSDAWNWLVDWWVVVGSVNHHN